MTPLEPMLRAAAADVAWPPTPDLAGAVAQRIGADAGGTRVAGAWRLGRRHIRIGRPLAIALAALLLLAATAAAVPGIREPVLDWLGLRSVEIERVPRPLPEPAGRRLALGRQTTLARALERIQFAPALPTGLGKPTVYYASFPPGGRLALVYRSGRLFITELQGNLDRGFLFKFAGASTGVEPLRVNGERGLWIDGPHQYAYADRDGQIRTDTVRTAGPVLLWRRGELLLRLEGARSRQEALRIASSLRAGP